MLERVRDTWERMGPRERRLASMLGFVVVVCLLGYVVFLINDGLNDLENRNADTRALLLSLETHRDDLAADRSKQGGAEAGVQIRAQTERPTQIKGKFHELATQIVLFDLNLDQLAKFLRGIETTSPIVVTRHLLIKRSALQKEKFDRVEITVATYQRVKAGAAKPADKTAEETK